MSSFQCALTQYLAARRALGSSLREPEQALRRLAETLDREGVPFLTTQRALNWATESPSVQRATWARRLAIVRGFATWLHVTDPRTEIPPRGLLNVRHRRKPPHIFTEVDITRLMDEASRTRCRSRLRAVTYSTLIGLMAATGLRTGEALALDVGDVDLVQGILTVRDTKCGKSRFVPVDASTRAALAAYSRRRQRLCSNSQSKAFLVSEGGKRLLSHSARRMFARVTRRLGMRPPAAKKRRGRGPRLQDLRHTFATGRLIEWYRTGVDVGRRIPALSTYLGHAGIQSTYWYIEAVPELLALASERRAPQGGAR